MEIAMPDHQMQAWLENLYSIRRATTLKLLEYRRHMAVAPRSTKQFLLNGSRLQRAWLSEEDIQLFTYARLLAENDSNIPARAIRKQFARDYGEAMERAPTWKKALRNSVAYAARLHYVIARN